jgi:toxin ParE1/3/4
VKLVFTPSARLDISRLVDFIARKNPAAARVMKARLIAGVNTLQVHPSLGRLGLLLNTRELLLPPYIVVYRLQPSCVEIIYIYYGPEDRMKTDV